MRNRALLPLALLSLLVGPGCATSALLEFAQGHEETPVALDDATVKQGTDSSTLTFAARFSGERICPVSMEIASLASSSRCLVLVSDEEASEAPYSRDLVLVPEKGGVLVVFPEVEEGKRPRQHIAIDADEPGERLAAWTLFVVLVPVTVALDVAFAPFELFAYALGPIGEPP